MNRAAITIRSGDSCNVSVSPSPFMSKPNSQVPSVMPPYMAAGVAAMRVAVTQAATDLIVRRFVKMCRAFRGNHTTMKRSMQMSMIINFELKDTTRAIALYSLQA